jgi:hypothetical protein
VRAGLGELAELFVDGQRVTPDRPQALRFKFRYATIGAALEQALTSSSHRDGRIQRLAVRSGDGSDTE